MMPVRTIVSSFALIAALTGNSATVASAIPTERRESGRELGLDASTVSCNQDCVKDGEKVRSTCFQSCSTSIAKGRRRWKKKRGLCKSTCQKEYGPNVKNCKDSKCVSVKQESSALSFELQALCEKCPCCRNDPTFLKVLRAPHACEIKETNEGTDYKGTIEETYSLHQCVMRDDATIGYETASSSSVIDYEGSSGSYHNYCSGTTPKSKILLVDQSNCNQYGCTGFPAFMDEFAACNDLVKRIQAKKFISASTCAASHNPKSVVALCKTILA